MSILKVRHIFCLSFLSPLVLAGCQTIKVAVPEVKQVESVAIERSSDMAAIKFATVGVKIKRGTPIGSYDSDPLTWGPCAGLGGNVFWNQGRIQGRDIEFADIFYEEMSAAQFNVVGNPEKMFSQFSDHQLNAAYLIGGQIDKIALNICRDKIPLSQILLGTTSGKGAVTVNWEVFSVLDRKVIYKTKTEGSGSLKQGSPNGEIELIQDAFANAVKNLTGDTKLVALLTEGTPSIADIKKVDKARLSIKRYRPRTESITSTIDNTRLAVATIERGTGHGSGFFITPTLILTNNHVVDNAQFVKIRLLTGRSILGEVIRKHPQRDVALIQVEAAGVTPLPIRIQPLKITEEVYAVGSPLTRSNSSTVTKGIVSKFPRNSFGMEDIQADVDIQGGSSGGVLLDSSGNVVGVSYAGIGPQGQFSAGINFFIPIIDALKKLNMKFKSETETS